MVDIPPNKSIKIQSHKQVYYVNFLGINSILEKIRVEYGNNTVFLIDKKFNELYPELIKSLNNYRVIEIIANEKSKSFESLDEVLKALLSKGLRREDTLIAIGGGIIQDITCFISQIMFRGVRWIFIPTSLLSQGDSCIGSKSSINYAGTKNLIGGFYPPLEIFIDVKFLESLDYQEILSGLGEMLHYFPLESKSKTEKFRLILPAALSRSQFDIKDLVHEALLIKKKTIEVDEYDTGDRLRFNYGHSFAHAIEAFTDYEIPHGIAVAIGIFIANQVAVDYSILEAGIANEINDLARSIYIKYSFQELNTLEILEHLKKDKKNKKDRLGLILLHDYGNAKLHYIKPDESFCKSLSSAISKLR